jgi:hypothetical protein
MESQKQILHGHILLFYNLHTNAVYLSKIYHQIKFKDPILNGTSGMRAVWHKQSQMNLQPKYIS